jgi:hypothetical protein
MRLGGLERQPENERVSRSSITIISYIYKAVAKDILGAIKRSFTPWSEAQEIARAAVD